MNKKNYKYCFFENKIQPLKNAKVSIMTNALQYGTGVFGGIRGYYDKKEKHISIFRLEDHIERFLNSLKILDVTIKYSANDLKKIVLQLVKKNSPKADVYFRPFAYAGSTNLGPNLLKDSKFSFALYIIPLGDYLPTTIGLKTIISSWQRVADNALPPRGKISGAYINSALARAEAAKSNCDEAIMLNQKGYVAEGSAENIFIVRNNTLITPPINDGVLEGITRRTILKLARDLNIKIQIRRIEKSELYICDECFFTGTGVQVAWIKQIDGRKIGNGKHGEISQKLQNIYFKTVKAKIKKYQSWCTIVSTK